MGHEDWEDSSASLAIAEGAVESQPADEKVKAPRQLRTLKKGMTDLFDADGLGDGEVHEEGKHGSKEKPPRQDALGC